MDKRDANGLTEAEFLVAYKQKDYPRPSLTADVAAFVKGAPSESPRVLLVRRGGHPFLGCWALPGGFVNQGESAESAATRELMEETGVADLILEQLGAYSTPGRDPRGWTVSSAYAACLEEAAIVTAGDDAADAQWCPFEAEEKPDGIIALTVHAGEDVLACSFREKTGVCMPARAEVLSSQGFAFDHADIIADAYLCVRALL